LNERDLWACPVVDVPRFALGSGVARVVDRARFRRVTPGIETLRSNFSMPRHRHLRPYATVVIAGTFEESGYVGRIRATAGDVLIHPALDCHANLMVSAGVTLLRLDWPESEESGGLYRVDDVDAFARAAEKDVREARQLLDEQLPTAGPTPGACNDWPDLLANALSRDPGLEIGRWAEANDLRRETVSRGFAAAYGVAPVVYRGELRARAAWLRITSGSLGLSRIAVEAGFADQAHMTRDVSRLTGAPPTAWRKEADPRS
jgi:AraC-like DNA-binding protein